MGFRGNKRQEVNGNGGNDLLSQEPALQVPSTRVGLTAGFEKGPGGPPPP